MFKKRLGYLYKVLKQEGLDAILISYTPNISYLTGLRNIEGHLLINKDHRILFTDFRYLKSSLDKCKENKVKIAEYKSEPFKTIAKITKRTSLKTLGLESERLSFSRYKGIEKNFSEKKIKIIPTRQIIEKIREKKDETELKLIQKAAGITRQTLDFAKEIMYPGITEKYLSIEIEKAMRLKGDSRLAFSTIVAAGRNSSEPHHLPDHTRIPFSKQPVLIDLGARHQGYCADLTRVLFLSKMPRYIKKIFDIVLKARELSIKKVKAGVKINKIDKAARDYIDKKGYAKFFGHALGHGVGLQVHERPYINKTNESFLKAGSVITIEPAIYLPGRFGIRYESMLIVTEKKAEIIDEHI